MSSDEIRQIIQHLDKNHLEMVRRLAELESRMVANHEDLTQQILGIKNRIVGIEDSISGMEKRLKALEDAKC